MTHPVYRTLLMCCLVIFTGCAGGTSKWRHFHGDLAAQGYQPVESGYALSAAWIAGPYHITSSSPVIGVVISGREVIYIGTVDGELVAINSEDGTERWRRSFAPQDKIFKIVSSPAISGRGDIYVIASHRVAGGRLRSSLHKVDEFSKVRWSYTFADNGFTSGSPKILKWGQQTLIFIYVTVVIGGEPQAELFVLRDNGKTADLLDRKAIGSCQWGSAEQGTHPDDVFNSFAKGWDFISTFPLVLGENGNTLPDTFVDPTVAVLTDRKLPLIAVADNLCSIGAYEWSNKGLVVVWGESHPFEKHSSPVLLNNGLMVFGRLDGKVLAHDVETGVKLWEYDAGQPVLATPAATPEDHIFIVSKSRIQVLNQQDGSLIYDGVSPRKFELGGQTYASPVVTENCVYVSSGEMLTLSHDLSTRSQDTNFRGNGLASIALANNGALYVVADDGTIRKYQGAQ
ncbi:MAG: PQQ-binding-like beta-propeller repeat protein [Desulfobacterales bacterium]|nr:PQQ-binding-like beta-propeller repeat protein [Desulfobacterales bacterium]